MIDITAAAQAISQILNPAVRSAAQAALNLAQSTDNQYLADSVAGILSKSAKGNGTAIFYTRNDATGEANFDAAKECRDKLTGAKSYMWGDTEAGQYAMGRGAQLTPASDDALQTVASAMMGDQARRAE